MSTGRVCVGVFFRLLQFVGDIACFATSLRTYRPYNSFIITVTVLNFIYNCYIWFGVPILAGKRAYNGILFGGDIMFFLLYIGSSIFQLFTAYTYYWNEYDSGLSFSFECYYASWCIGVTCAALYYITFIMYVCWGVIPASKHGFWKRSFEKQPFKFGCLVFDNSQVCYESKRDDEIDLWKTQHFPSKNTGAKQKSIDF